MPKIKCSICCCQTEVLQRKWKYLDRDGPFVCSIQCARGWIHKSTALVRLFDVLFRECEGDVCKSNCSSNNDIYSYVTKRCYKSTFELEFDEFCQASKLRTLYERYTIRWNGHEYTPDFIIVSGNYFCIVDTKGRWGSGQRKKYKDFRETFPNIPFLVLPWTVYNGLKCYNRKRICGVPPKLR